MPNTPAAIGRAITVACPNPRVTAAQRRLCDGLLAAIGESAWVEDEALMDAVTAVSGSGPAYVFLLIEALARGRRARGAAGRSALRLARSTVAGAGELARLSPETPGAAARERHQPGRHHARRARCADGERTVSNADQARGRRGHGAIARTGELRLARTQPMAKRPRHRCRDRAAAPPSDRDRIIDAALALMRHARAGGACRWPRSPPQAGLPILTLYRAFPSKPAILCGFSRRIDETVLAEPPARPSPTSARATGCSIC